MSGGAPSRLTERAVRAALQETTRFRMSPRMRRIDASGAAIPRVMAPPPGVAPTNAAVLVPLYSAGDGLVMVFTRRTDHLAHHAGQISFPGGRVEAADASLFATAQRETAEELGVPPEGWTMWAALASVYVPPSNFLVHPFVAHAPRRLDFRPSEDEIAEVLEIPLRELLDPSHFTLEPRDVDGRIVQEPGFRHGAHRIWGATAAVLDQVLTRLERSLGAEL